MLTEQTLENGKPRVLLVEDDEIDIEWISRLVGQEVELVACSTAAAARPHLGNSSLSCVLMDFGLPDTDGAAFISECAAYGLPVIVLTGQAAASQAVTGMKAGAYDYLIKDSLNVEILRQTLHKAVERDALKRRLQRQEHELASAHSEITMRERRLSLILESIREGFWIAAEDWSTVLYASPMVETIWDRTIGELAIDPERLLDSILASDRSKVEEVRQTTEKSYDVNYRYRRSCGTLVWLREKATRTSQDGLPVWVGVTEDITQSKELELQFFQAQKMEALGRLAGGLAHDFNNILSVIVGYSHLAAEGLSVGHQALEDLAQVQLAGQQAKGLVKQLLAFSREKDSTEEYSDLSETISELGQLLSRTIGDHITLQVFTPKESLPIKVERNRLEQVLMNLIVNGRDAMPDGGAIKVTASRVGDLAVLTVRDHGIGISMEDQARIFEPFFTTKADQGTGLGLSTVFGIVSSHGGEISLTSQVGEGTEFRVTFPICEDQLTATALVESQQRQARSAFSGTILVVENEDPLRSLLRRVLEKRGYHVLEAADGLQGLMLGQKRREEILAVVTDIKMPGTGGRDMARQINTPDQKAIPTLYISGYRGEELGEMHLGYHESLLEKPFSAQDLVDSLEEILGRNSAPNP